MKLVFTREEVAAALGQSAGDFDILRPLLEAEGFPKPVRGLSTCWSIMDVIAWVNRDGRPVDLPFSRGEKEGSATKRWEDEGSRSCN